MSQNQPKGPAPRLGTPQIKSGPGRPAERPAGQSAEEPLPTRRSLRQHRRADSAAGTPAGKASQSAIFELPALIISPSDVGPLTGQLPTVIYSARRGAGTGYALKSAAAPATDVRVDPDGVPVGPDGHPLTRRELRERRRHQEASAGSEEPSADGGHPQARRAEAPAGSPGTMVTPAAASDVPQASSDSEETTRESLAAAGAALAAKIEESGGTDPSAVDPVLLREQELLAERARQLNTGLISQVPVAEPAVTAPAAAAVSTPTTAPAQEPVQAESAHGLDSLEASAWSSRERTLLLVAALVILFLLVALVLALVL